MMGSVQRHEGTLDDAVIVQDVLEAPKPGSVLAEEIVVAMSNTRRPSRARDGRAPRWGPPPEAQARLLRAVALVRDGRHAEADAELNLALMYFRSVWATAFTRRGESLLAATA